MIKFSRKLFYFIIFKLTTLDCKIIINYKILFSQTTIIMLFVY